MTAIHNSPPRTFPSPIQTLFRYKQSWVQKILAFGERTCILEELDPSPLACAWVICRTADNIATYRIYGCWYDELSLAPEALPRIPRMLWREQFRLSEYSLHIFDKIRVTKKGVEVRYTRTKQWREFPRTPVA